MGQPAHAYGGIAINMHFCEYEVTRGGGMSGIGPRATLVCAGMVADKADESKECL